MIKKKKAIIILALIAWFLINRPLHFGIHFFAFTVYSGIPIPYFDLKIHANGIPSIRKKSHYVSIDEVKPLLEENPEVIIIGIGYNEMVKVDKEILKLNVGVLILETSEAIKAFNQLKSSGVKVAAIIHTTC